MQKQKVLIVEPDVEVRNSISSILMAKFNASVFYAKDGSVAKWKINNDTFHLVIVDFNLPRCSGVNLIKFISNLPAEKKPKHIFLMGVGVEKDVEEQCMSFGVQIIAKSNYQSDLLNNLPMVLIDRNV